MNDDGIGYNWLILMIALVGGIFAYSALLPVFNVVFSTSDDMISDGTMSAQTKKGMDFQRNLITWVPVIIAVGLLIYAIYSANAEKAGRI